MAWNLDYETRRVILRILTIGAGIYCLFPDSVSQIANYPILDIIYPRMIVGAAAILYIIGDWKKWW